MLYDLTSTYFEAEPPFPDGDKRRFGYSRDHRPDCVQVVIALVVTPEGLPLAYEVLSGNTSDKTTLRDFLARIERQYGKAWRVWLMDRGIPTEETLAEMREADPPVRYLVGTPKGRLNRLERDLSKKPWQEARPGVQVKLLPQDGELYCLHVTVGLRLKGLAPGPTPRSLFEKFAAVQMIDVHIPTTDGRELQLTRTTQPEPELTLLLNRLRFELPNQPPPKITAAEAAAANPL